MRHTPPVLSFLALTALTLSVAAPPAQAQSTLRVYGALSNFDCSNDTETETEGFEIEIEGEHKEDITHTWAYSAFGAPTVEDGGTAAKPTAIIRYRSKTVSLLPKATTHFGVGLNNVPKSGAIHYRWLIKGTAASPNPLPVVVPLPTQEAQITYASGVPIVQDIIRNNAPEGGPSFWVLPYAHLLYRQVSLEELMPDNPVVTDGIPEGNGPDGTLPELLGPGESWSNDDSGADAEEASSVYTYEIYVDVVTVVNGKTTHSPGAMTANMMNATLTASGPLVPNQLTLSTPSAYGTQTVTGTVTVNGFAPAGGFVVNLAANNPSVTLPASVMILAGQSSAAFTVSTTAVAVPTLVTLVASDTGKQGLVSGSLTVLPPDLAQLYLAYSLNFSGSAFNGAVYLTTPAPSGGMTVNLSSSNPAVASVPATVTVPAGLLTASFAVQTFSVTATQRITITGQLASVSLTQDLYVAPAPRISGVITLEQCINSAQDIALEFRPVAGGPTLTRLVTLDSAGAFAVTDAPPGKYNLAIKGGKWLRSVIAIDSTVKPVTNANAVLLAGDANNDNSVDSTDFGILIGAFNTSASIPGSGYDATADFNCDGSVDSTDFGLLINNFNNMGAP